MVQPPIVIECIECGEKYLIYKTMPELSDEAKQYADGYFEDKEIWRTPGIIGCVTCELGFFPAKGKIIAEPSWDEFNEKWNHINKALPPDAGVLALELRVRKKMERDNEIALRKEFWYAGNYTEKGRLLMNKNPRFKKYWHQSLEKLTFLLENEPILRAEALRQLGNFNEAEKILPHSNKNITQIIHQKISKKDTLPIVLQSF